MQFNHGAIGPSLVWDSSSTMSRKAYVRSSVAGTCYSLIRWGVCDPLRMSSLCLGVDGGNFVAPKAVVVSTTKNLLSKGSRILEVGRHFCKVYGWDSYRGRASVYHSTVHKRSWRCCCSHGRGQVCIRVIEANNCVTNRTVAATNMNQSDGDPTTATYNGGPAYSKASSVNCSTG